MVNYLDSRRIAGTTAERSSIPAPATTGGWVELGRTTLGSANDNITVSGLADKRYLMTLFYSSGGTGGNSEISWQLNGDTGSNYAFRYSSNGGGDGGYASQSYMHGDPYDANDSNPRFSVSYLTNYASKEKLHISHSMRSNTAGAANAPARGESVSKWANTSNAVSSITANNRNTGTWSTGDEVVVLGWDPADTHATNFWTELADVTLNSAGDNLSSGTITAKKYLWVQAYLQDNGSAIRTEVTFNNDTGNNYSERFSNNGGADSTDVSRARFLLESSNVAEPTFVNMFIINNASNEKLVIAHSVREGGAGAGNDPDRREIVAKWANTSNQITEIDFTNIGAGNFGTSSFIKVWGSD